MFNTFFCFKKLHGLLRLSYGAFFKTETILTNSTIPNASEVKAQNDEAHRCQFSRNLHINAPGPDAMYNSCIEQDDGRPSARNADSYRFSHNSDERLPCTKKNGFFFHE